MKKKSHRVKDVFAISLERVQYSSPSSECRLFYVVTKEEQGAVVKAYLDWIKDPVTEHRIVEINWIKPLAIGTTPKTGTAFIDLAGVIALQEWIEAFPDPAGGH